jgi:hypothetical protein
MKIFSLALVLVSCATTHKTLSEPEGTMMYMQMIQQSGFPVTVVQCIESKVDLTRKIESTAQLDAMSAAAQACVNDFKETDSGKRFMEFLKAQMAIPAPSQKDNVTDI